jgi:hypothetical protein
MSGPIYHLPHCTRQTHRPPAMPMAKTKLPCWTLTVKGRHMLVAMPLSGSLAWILLKRGEPCYDEATDRLRELAGDSVRVQFGPRQGDQFGRILYYVYNLEGESIDEKLVREGLALAWLEYGQHRGALLAAEAIAKEAGRGCLGGGSEAPVPAGDCEPSYPTVCIPSSPPDLDCRDIPYRRFEVLPSDPHRFDGDKDGVGCES